MLDRIDSQSDYSRLLSDQASSIGNVASSLKAHCSYVSSKAVPLVCSNSVLAESSGFLFISKQKNTVVVWDLTKNEQVGVLSTSGTVSEMQVSEVGDLLAILDLKPTITLWELPSLRRMSEIKVPAETDCFAFGSSSLFVSHESSSIAELDFGGDLIRQIQLDGQSVTSIFWHSSFLYIGTKQGTVQVVNAQSGDLIRSLDLHRMAVVKLIVLTDFMVSSSLDKTIKITSTNSFNYKVLRLHEDSSTDIAVTKDEKYLVSANAHNKILVTEIASVQTHLELSTTESNIAGLIVTSDLAYIISSSRNGVKAWTLSAENESSYFADSPSPIVAFTYSADKQYMFTASEAGVFSYDTIMGHRDNVINRGSVTAIASSPTELALGFADGNLQILDGSNWNTLRTFTNHKRQIMSLVFKGIVLYSAALDYTIKVWDVARLELKVNLTARVGPLISLSDTWMVCAVGAVIEIWDIKEPVVPTHWGTVESHQNSITCFDILEESNTLLSGSLDCSVRLTNLRKCQEKQRLCYHELPIVSVKYQKDYEVLISASEDCSVVIWSTIERLVLAKLSIPDKPSSMLLDPLYGMVMISTEKGIYSLKNPLQSDKITVHPSKYSSIFLYWVHQIFSNKKPRYNPDWKYYTIFPWRMNVLHLLTYSAHVDALCLALRDGVVFLRSDKGETPLTLAIQRNNRLVLDTILSSVTASSNIGLWRSIEEILHTLNSGSLPSLHKVYTAAFPVKTDDEVPCFGIFKKEPPVIYMSKRESVHAEHFLDLPADKKSNEEALEFRVSRIGLNLSSGSEESLAFLQSLRDCSNTEVFSTLLVQAILTFKVQKFKWFNSLRVFVSSLALLFIALHVFVFPSSVVVITGLLLCVVFFFFIELLRVFSFTVEYFFSLWRILDFLTVIFGGVYCILMFTRSEGPEIDLVIGPLVFLFWMKFFSELKNFDSIKPIFLFFEYMFPEFCSSFLVIIGLLLVMGLSLSLASDISIQDSFAQSSESFFGIINLKGMNVLGLMVYLVFCGLLNLFMFNLLIAVAIKNYKNTQERFNELKYVDMVKNAIDCETLLIWRRQKGRRKFVQQCSNPGHAFENAIEEENKEYNKMIRRQKKQIRGCRKEMKMKELKEEIEVIREEMRVSFEEVSSILKKT